MATFPPSFFDEVFMFARGKTAVDVSARVVSRPTCGIILDKNRINFALSQRRKLEIYYQI